MLRHLTSQEMFVLVLKTYVPLLKEVKRDRQLPILKVLKIS